MLSSAALLALFSVVLPVVSAARISNLLISAAITGFLVLGLSVMFELATYLDAFVVLVPSAAEATQTTLNDRLVTSARGTCFERFTGLSSASLLLNESVTQIVSNVCVQWTAWTVSYVVFLSQERLLTWKERKIWCL